MSCGNLAAKLVDSGTEKIDILVLLASLKQSLRVLEREIWTFCYLGAKIIDLGVPGLLRLKGDKILDGLAREEILIF